jgi:hypothetical protein
LNQGYNQTYSLAQGKDFIDEEDADENEEMEEPPVQVVVEGSKVYG